MKDLAVLIPVFNDQEALDKALDSIDEPDTSFTVVIVDGASEDKTVVDRDRYPFEIVIIREEVNNGLAGDLNVGIEYIRENGFKYLARFDAGDVACKNRLAIQYRHFQESDELVLLGSNVVFSDEETGEPLFVTDLPLSWKDIRKWCVFRTCFVHPTVMLRLDRLDPSFKYDTAYPHIEDYVLFTRIAERYPSEVLKEPLLDCSVRKDGISRRSDRHQLISGIRHHLRHPRVLNPLWYAYLAKRTFFLAVPHSMRNRLKKWLGLVVAPASPNPAVQLEAQKP